MDQRLPPDFEEFLRLLASHEVESIPAPRRIWSLDRHFSAKCRAVRPDEEANYEGASYGWQGYFGGLERVAAGLD